MSKRKKISAFLILLLIIGNLAGQTFTFYISSYPVESLKTNYSDSDDRESFIRPGNLIIYDITGKKISDVSGYIDVSGKVRILSGNIAEGIYFTKTGENTVLKFEFQREIK